MSHGPFTHSWGRIDHPCQILQGELAARLTLRAMILSGFRGRGRGAASRRPSPTVRSGGRSRGGEVRWTVSRVPPLHTAQRPSGAATVLNTGLPRPGTPPASLLSLERTLWTHEEYLKLMESVRASAALSLGGEGGVSHMGAGGLPVGGVCGRSSASGALLGCPESPFRRCPTCVPAAARDTPRAHTRGSLRLDSATGSLGWVLNTSSSATRCIFEIIPRVGMTTWARVQPGLQRLKRQKRLKRKKESKRRERVQERPEPVGLS